MGRPAASRRTLHQRALLAAGTVIIAARGDASVTGYMYIWRSPPPSKTDDGGGASAAAATAARAATGRGAPATLSGADRIPVLNPKRLPGAGLAVLDRITPLGILGDFKPDIVLCKNGDLLVMAVTYAGGLSGLDPSDYNASNPENGYCHNNWVKNALFRSKGASSDTVLSKVTRDSLFCSFAAPMPAPELCMLCGCWIRDRRRPDVVRPLGSHA